MEEEKELFWLVTDNGDMSFHCRYLSEAADILELDILDVSPGDREEVFYTLTPVYMTESEFESLPDSQI